MKDILRRLMVLAIIAIGLTSCGEGGDPEQIPMANSIIGVARVRGTLYLADDAEGVWRLNNKTSSWELTNYRDPVHRIIAVNDTLYLNAAGHVYCLNPDGDTFTLIIATQTSHLFEVDGDYFYSTSREKLLRQKKEDSEAWLEFNTSFDDDITAITVEGDTIFASTFNFEAPYSNTHRLFGSVDGGHSWTEISGFPDITVDFLTHPLHFYQNTLYIATTKGVYRLRKGSTTATPTGLDGRGILSIVASETTLYAGTWGDGVFRSNDGGDSWQPIGLSGESVRTLAVFNNRLYAGMRRSGGGVYYTADEGVSWHTLNKGLNLPNDE